MTASRIDDLDTLVGRLKPYLRRYLEERGVEINTNGQFRCINPKHKDSKPSCGFVKNTDEQVFHCFSCLPGDGLIRCVDGIKEIKDSNVGDGIYTASGDVGRIVRKTEVDGSKKSIYEFTLGNVYRSTQSFTGDHTMLVVRDIIGKVPYITNYLGRNGKFSSGAKNRERSNKYKDLINIEEIPAREVVAGDYFLMPQTHTGHNPEYLENTFLKPYSSGPQNERILKIDINEETMWLFGIYCAEGSSYRGGIAFTLGPKEMDLALKIKRIINKYFNKNVTIFNKICGRNTIDLRCSSTDMEMFFKNFFGIGAENKTAPYQFTSYPLSLQSAFWDGMFDGDGTKKRGILTTVSKQLMLLSKQILVNLSIPHSISLENGYVDKTGLRHTDAYRIAVLKKENCNCFYENIDGITFCLQRIVGVRRNNPILKVYDITVEGGGYSNTFLCEHYAVHNCGAKGSIVHAAHLIEGKPMRGQEFVDGNVVYLANKYGIDVKTIELTPEEMYIKRVYRAYDEAAEIVSENQPLDYIVKRKWPVSLCRELQIGSVSGYEDFVSRMESRGYERQFIEEIDLNRNIFSVDKLIFTVKDEKGRVVGFSARDMNYSKDVKRPKFINTSSKCPIYNKGVVLYGLNIGRNHQPPLYIFEGYPDYVTAFKYGIKNICAIGGTALTRDHINLIKDLGISDIILALDGDTAGQLRTEKLLDEYFGGDETLRVRMVRFQDIPGESDPDEFLEKKGVDAFNSLQMLTPFQWRLDRFTYETKPEDICDIMIPLIVADPNEVHREAMTKELADKTGIRQKTVLKQVDKIINAEEAQKDGVIQNRVKQLIDDLKTRKSEPATLLERAAEELRQLNSEAREEVNSSVEVVSFIDGVRKVFEDRKPGLQGLKTGYDVLDNCISGIPAEDAMITFAGDSNVGKCLKFDSNVLLSDGSYDTIQNIVINKTSGIIKMKDHKLIPGKVSNWIDSGMLECFRVSTKSGISTEPSSTHPYYTINGWKKVSELKIGDKIAISSNYGCFDSIDNELSNEQAEFLGYILAEGGITREIRFTNTDDQIVNRFCDLTEILFPGSQIRKEDITYYITDKNNSGNRAKEWIKSLGLFGCDSHEKFIPTCIFKSSKEKIATFLGAFYACDGWVCLDKHERIEVGTSLCNRKLVEQIRSLLLRFGIKAKISDGKSTCNGKVFDRYTIALHDYDNAFKFYDYIQILLDRKQEVLENYICTALNARGAYGDSMPHELWGYIESKSIMMGLTMAKVMERADPDNVCIYFDRSRQKFRRRTYVPSRETNITRNLLARIAAVLSDEFLQSVADGDIYFDEIVSIDNIGRHQCYDLTVDGDHNFISNDTIVHNTGYMFDLALRLAKNNENVMVLFMSIDDSRQQAIARLVALEGGLKIKQVSHPVQNVSTDEDKEKLNTAWARIRELVDSGRFSIKDNSHGNTLDFAEGWIRWAKTNNPEKKIVFFLDNFHKLGDEPKLDERIRFKHASARIHAMKNKLHFTAICTMEIRKLLGASSSSRPMLQDISESKQMEYDNNLIGMVYSDVHAKRMEAKTFWMEEVNGEAFKKPVFEIDIQKNKISEFKGTLYYKFSPEYSKFGEVSGEEVLAWQKDYSIAMKSMMDKRFPDGGQNPFLTQKVVTPNAEAEQQETT